jgi:hypothetical protein
LSVMAVASFISRFALHFTQYAWTMGIHPPGATSEGG